MKTLLSILLSLSVLTPIKLDRYRNSINNTGNSNYNNFVQCTYLYSVDSPSNEIDVSLAGWVGTTYEMPQVYKFTLKINFREPVHNATMLLSFTTPDTYAYNYNYIAENCFVTGSSGNITVTAYNTDFCMIEFYFSGHMLVEMYDYPISATTTWSLDPTENKWVQNGYSFFDLTGVRLDSVSLEPTQNYNTELNSIMNSVDGIESLLTSIKNNTSYISNIDTNFTALLNAVNAINNKIDNINNIEWIDLNTQYKGYSTELLYNPTDLNTGTVTNNGTGYVYMYGTLPGNIASQFPLIKIVFPVEIFTIYQTFEFGFVGSNNALVKFDVLYTRSTRGAVEIYFTLDTPYYGLYDVHFCLKITGNNIVVRPTNDKGIFYINENDSNYWTVYSSLTQLNSLKGIQNSLDQIIAILGTTDISASDEQNKQTVDNKFNELLQNLTLPQVPERPSKVPYMKSLFEIFGDIINTPSLDMAKWFIGIEAIVMLMGVILR